MSVQPAKPSAGALLENALGSFGKLVAAVAAAGIFLYVIGAVVLWQRLASVGLPAPEVVGTIPRDQLAVEGAREALMSSISAAGFGFFLYILYRLFRANQQGEVMPGLRGRLARTMRERPAPFFAAVLTAWCAHVVLLLPFSADTAVFLGAFLAVVLVGLRTAHRSLTGASQGYHTSVVPWLRLAAGLAAAVLLISIERQREFPNGFALATIVVDDGVGVCGLYLGSIPEAIVVGQPPGRGYEDCKPVAATDPCLPPPEPSPAATILVARNKIESLSLTAGPPPCPPASSLLRRLGIPLECIFPVCHVGDRRRSFLPLIIDE